MHLVDLNGAVAGKPQNAAAIRAIVDAVGPKCRCSWAAASVRSRRSSATSTAAVSYVIIGTAAVKSPGFLHDACNAFPGQVIVGLDARDGKVATDGWSKLTRARRGRPRAQVRRLRHRGHHLHRHRPRRHDDRRQHRCHGAAWRRRSACRSIASGGVSILEDIDKLLAVESEGRRRCDPRALALRGYARFRRGPRAGRAANDRRRAGGRIAAATMPRRQPAT